MIVYYITTQKCDNKIIKVLLEGDWDGEKFTHIDSKGLELIVRKKEWLFNLTSIE